MSVLSLCESSCTVQRGAIGQDQRGGTLRRPVTIAKDLACSFQESSGNALDIYGQRDTVVSAHLYMPSDPGIEVDDLITVTDSITGEVSTLLALGQSQPVGRGRLYIVSVQRIRPPTLEGSPGPFTP
jgi:hypothetical protein